MKTEGEAPAALLAAGAAELGEGQPAGTERKPRQKKASALTLVESGALKSAAPSLMSLPRTGAWLARHNLKAVNFKLARREEASEDGYPRAVAWARFDSEKVEVGGDIEPPSPLEAEEMLKEIKAANFPKPTTLAALARLPDGVRANDPNVSICHDFDGRIAMLLQRYETPGGKGFKPWTPFDSGEWHCMEPEVMPFFGLPGAKAHSTLFIHEGAKAAARVKRIIDGELDARLPWLEALRWGHHVGWLGGVNALHRSEWTRLAGLGWKKVVIVADNDAPGWRPVGKIAEHFTCETKVVRFGGDWPPAFDLGDDWPKHLFDDSGRYVGKSFEDCCQAADWATDEVQVPRDSGNGFKTIPVLRQNFVERNFIITETQQAVELHRPSRLLSKDQYNEGCRWRSHARDTYSELLRHGEAICARRVYDPFVAAGPLIEDGDLCWNGFEAPNVRATKGDVSPFVEYLDHLTPLATDQSHIRRWIATLVARPDIRMRWSTLLISKTQGVGKSTLGFILEHLLGSSNVSYPSEKDIADSQFNGWALGKQLIVVNEIYSNGKATVYDKLKTFVTDERIPINEKFVRTFYVTNRSVILACSNSEKALYIPDEDRRWFIPTLTDVAKPEAYWTGFYAWLKAEGFGIILGWAREYVKTDFVTTGTIAPPSSAKQAIIAASKSEGRLHARDFAEEFAKLPDRTIVKVGDLQAWVAGKRHMSLDDRRLEREKTLIDEVETVGGIHVLKGDQRPKIGGRKGAKASVILNFEPEPGTAWLQLEPHLRTLEQIGFHDDF